MGPAGSRHQDRMRNTRGLVQEISVEKKGQRSQGQLESSDHAARVTPGEGEGRGRRI